MKVFIWEMILVENLKLIRQGSLCANSKREAELRIRNTMSPDEKSFEFKLKIKELKWK